MEETPKEDLFPIKWERRFTSSVIVGILQIPHAPELSQKEMEAVLTAYPSPDPQNECRIDWLSISEQELKLGRSANDRWPAFVLVRAKTLPSLPIPGMLYADGTTGKLLGVVSLEEGFSEFVPPATTPNKFHQAA